MVLILSLVMGACGSSEDADDTKPTKSDNPTNEDKEETVKVTFDLNYTGATDTPSAQTIKKGDKATVPTEPTRAGYKLTNWYTDQATTKTFAFTTPINADITLYAGWQRSVYTVTFDSNGGTGTVAEQPIPKNGKATAPNATDNPTKGGHVFDGWYTQQDGSGTAFAFTRTIITADMTLYARWTPVYTVTFDNNYPEAAAPTTATVEHSKTTTAPADPTRDGYVFKGWYEKQDGSGTAFAFGTTPITADITLYAKWICPAREARETLTHAVPLYNQGEADAPYLPKVLRRDDFKDDSGKSLYFLFLNMATPPTPEQADELPYIWPVLTTNLNVEVEAGNFNITPDYIESSIRVTGINTLRISCYSVKQVEENLYFYYGKVRFLIDGQETEAFNKAMYAWTGIDKRDDANKDALYGYMVSIQGDYLRPLVTYPFVGATYTSDGKTVTFPKTEQDYADLTLEDLKIIATAPFTSDKIFGRLALPGGIYDGQ